MRQLVAFDVESVEREGELVVLLALLWAGQTPLARPVAVIAVSHVGCVGADGQLYGLKEGPAPTITCEAGDGTVQADLPVLGRSSRRGAEAAHGRHFSSRGEQLIRDQKA